MEIISSILVRYGYSAARYLPTWGTTNPVVNPAHVTGGYMGTMKISDEGEASLYPFTLR